MITPADYTLMITNLPLDITHEEIANNVERILKKSRSTVSTLTLPVQEVGGRQHALSEESTKYVTKVNIAYKIGDFIKITRKIQKLSKDLSVLEYKKK